MTIASFWKIYVDLAPIGIYYRSRPIEDVHPLDGVQHFDLVSASLLSLV